MIRTLLLVFAMTQLGTPDSQGQVGTPYDKLSETDFFGFFGVREVHRTPLESGRVAVDLKTGGFQQHIDIRLALDASGNVQIASLFVDRSWLGNANSINRLGCDVIKSFLATFPPAGDRQAAEPLIQAIWNAKGSKDEVIRLDGEPAPAGPTGLAKEGLEVIFGSRPSYLQDLTTCSIRLDNVSKDGRDRLRVRIGPIQSKKSEGD